jgi:hypothetical protein
MGRHRAREEKLQRIRLGSRYFGFNLAQFYWECLQLASASEGLTETDILRRIIRSWSETLSTAIREKARAETTRVEAWKAQEKRAQRDAKLKAKKAKLNPSRPTSRGKESAKAPNARGTTEAVGSRTDGGIADCEVGFCGGRSAQAEVNSPKPH